MDWMDPSESRDPYRRGIMRRLRHGHDVVLGLPCRATTDGIGIGIGIGMRCHGTYGDAVHRFYLEALAPVDTNDPVETGSNFCSASFFCSQRRLLPPCICILYVQSSYLDPVQIPDPGGINQPFLHIHIEHTPTIEAKGCTLRSGILRRFSRWLPSL